MQLLTIVTLKQRNLTTGQSDNSATLQKRNFTTALFYKCDTAFEKGKSLLYKNAILPHHNFTTVQLYNSVTLQQRNFTTAQVYNSATLQQRNFTTAQLLTIAIRQQSNFFQL